MPELGISSPLSVSYLHNVTAPVLIAIFYYFCYACFYRQLQAGCPSGLFILCTTATEERSGALGKPFTVINTIQTGLSHPPKKNRSRKVMSSSRTLQVLWWSPSWSVGSLITYGVSCFAMSPPVTGQSESRHGGRAPPPPGWGWGGQPRAGAAGATTRLGDGSRKVGAKTFSARGLKASAS